MGNHCASLTLATLDFPDAYKNLQFNSQLHMHRIHSEGFKPSSISKSSHLSKGRRAQEETSSCLCYKSALDKQPSRTLTETGGVSVHMAYFSVLWIKKAMKCRNVDPSLIKKIAEGTSGISITKIFRTHFEEQHSTLAPEVPPQIIHKLAAQPVPRTDQGKLSNIPNATLWNIWVSKLSFTPEREGGPTYCRSKWRCSSTS